jgi:DNA (cytosine-5)-methyltransferase 1
MEAVRIIKEMRETDVRSGRSGVDVQCRYGIYENVPGAFSSNGGEDFRVVLEELARVVEEGVTIPRPPKGKWATTGVIIGDGWSLAWRVFDAQYWGVPQRRRRICIVVDFNGHTAPQIVFSEGEHHGSTERGDRKPSVGYIGEEPRPEIQPLCEGLSRHLEQSQPQREDPSPNASGSLGAGDCEGKRHVGVDLYNTQITGDVEATLGVNCGMSHGRNGVIAYTMQDREGKAGGGKGALIAEEKSATLRANNWQYVFQPSSWDGGQTSPTLTARNASGCQRMPDKDNFNAVLQPIAIDMGGGKSSVDVHIDRSPTLTTTHYGEPAVVYAARGNGDGTVAPTMTGDHQNRVTDYTGVVVTYSKSKRAQSATDNETWVESDKTNTLNAFDVGDVRTTECVIALDRASFNQGKNAKYDFEVSEDGINSPIVAKGPSAVCVARAVDCRNCTEDDVNGSPQSNSAHSLNGNNVVRVKYIVRRLTPLECERLQGFPDGHTDIGEFIDTKGKKCKTSDASRYKALGNSIALPSWKFVLKRLCSHYERDATMTSLFDGIGGFPLIWEQINGKGSCLWASEIEEFPIAVTKARIGE